MRVSLSYNGTFLCLMRDASMPKLRQNYGVSGVHSRATLSSPLVSFSSEAAMALMNNSYETRIATQIFAGFQPCLC